MFKTKKLAIYIKTKNNIDYKKIKIDVNMIECSYDDNIFYVELEIINLKVILRNYNEDNVNYLILEATFSSNIDIISDDICKNIKIIKHDFRLLVDEREIAWSPVLVENSYFYIFY